MPVQARRPSNRDKFAHVFAAKFAASFGLKFGEKLSWLFLATFE